MTECDAVGGHSQMMSPKVEEIFTCGEACRSTCPFCPSFLLPGNKRLFHAFWGQKGTGTWVIEATEFKYEVRSDLGGHMEAAMASEAT